MFRILKAEVGLRDATRVVQQSRDGILPHQHEESSAFLEKTQHDLHQRTKTLIGSLEEMQESKKKNYGKAIGRLVVAADAMGDAEDLLVSAETGSPTIAAETEAIEALLITKRAGNGGDGGDGGTPGGGNGQGSAETRSALAGIGGDQLLTEDRGVRQATGVTRAQIPDEFRAGMDAYFSALEGGGG